MPIWTAQKEESVVVDVPRHDNDEVVSHRDVTVPFSCDDGRKLNIKYAGIITNAQLDNAINNQLDSLNGLPDPADLLAPLNIRVVRPPVVLTDEQRVVSEKARALQQVSLEAKIRSRGDAEELQALDDLKTAQAALEVSKEAEAEAEVAVKG